MIYPGTTVDYNSASPGNFLFNVLHDTDVAVPQIAVNSVQYLDPATGAPLKRVTPGQSVLVRVTATNSGPAAGVIARLIVDSDAKSSNGVLFNSGLSAPNQDLARSFARGKQVFDWVWQVPSNAPAGRCYVAVQFRDEHDVLSFKQSKYMKAFKVTAPSKNIPSQACGISSSSSLWRIRSRKHSPSGRVPVLLHRGLAVWESLAIAEMPDDVRKLCRLADISSKSLLLQIVRQQTPQKMVALIEQLTRDGKGAVTREQARKATAVKVVKPGRPKAFVFQYRPPAKTFNLRLQFRKSDVDRSEVIAALEAIIDELKSSK